MSTTPVPYITARKGEEADTHYALRATFDAAGMATLGYWDESIEDRDVRGVLWGRVSQSLGLDRLPIGEPQWRIIHPSRQRETMLKLLCQVCVQKARTPEGVVFLESKQYGMPSASASIRSAQPPLCLRHAGLAAQRCPHLVKHGHVALLVRSAPLYGVIGTPYANTASGLQAQVGSDTPVPYGDPALRWFLASQLVRTLRSFTVVDLGDLPPTR